MSDVVLANSEGLATSVHAASVSGWRWRATGGVAIAVALVVALAPPASAATLTWNTTSGTWDLSALNWDPGPVAWTQTGTTSAANDAVFGGVDGTYAVTLAGSQIAASNLTFNASGYTLSGTSLFLGSGTVSVAAGKAATISSVVRGTNGITKEGAGSLTLSAANTFTGMSTLSSGSLLLANNSALGSGTLTINGGSLVATVLSGGAAVNRQISNGTIFASDFTAGEVRGTGTAAHQLTLNGAITLTGNRTITVDSGAGFNLYGGISDGGNGYGLVKTGNAVFRIGGVNTYSGDTKAVGSIVIFSELALQKSAVDVDGAGNFNFNAGNSYVIGGLKGGRSGMFTTNSGTLTLRINPGAGVRNVYSGNLANIGSGSTNFIVIGSGTQVFSGTNTYSGTTEIRAGTLQIGNNGTTGRLSLSSAITGSAGGTLAFNRTNTVTQGTDFNSLISGGLGVAQLGSGTLVLNGANTYTGPTTVWAGVLRIGAANAIGNGSSVVVGGGGLDLNGFDDEVAAVTLTSGSIFGTGTLTAATYALAGGAVAANLGSGVLTVTGNSTLNGTSDATTVTLNAGALALGGANRFTSAAVAVSGSSGASLVLGGNESFGSLGGAANIALGANTLSVGGANTSTTYSGTVSGAGGLTKVGTGKLTLASPQAFTGSTVISGGTLALESGASLAQSVYLKAGAVAGDGGVLDVTALGGGLSVASGQKLGGYGTVLGDVVIANGAVVSPGGSIGTLDIDGTQTWGPAGRYLFEVTNAGGTPGVGWDLLTVNALTITATSGVGNQFVIDIQTLASGTAEIAGVMAGGNWNPNQSYQWKFLVADTTTFTATSFDPSWFSINTSATIFKNDINGSFSVARGDTVGGASNELFIVYAAVPEPGALAIAGGGLAVAGAGLMRRRRRRASRPA